MIFRVIQKSLQFNCVLYPFCLSDFSVAAKISVAIAVIHCEQTLNSLTYVIGIINDINGIKYSYFSFSHTLHIWRETTCNIQIASQMHSTRLYMRGVMLICSQRVIDRQTNNISSTAHFQVITAFYTF